MTTDFLVYLDIPAIPEDLLDPIQDIINAPPKPESRIPSSNYYFQTRLVSDKLFEWTKDTFKSECYVQYQIVRQGISIHKDIGRNVAFNYILEPGSDRAKTNFYDDNHRLLCSKIIQPKKWHRIKTDVFHNVSHILTDRVAVSVEVFDYVWNDPSSKW